MKKIQWTAGEKKAVKGNYKAKGTMLTKGVTKPGSKKSARGC